MIQTPVSVTWVQSFWGALALVGLVAVCYLAAQVGGTDAFVATITSGWGAATISLDLLLLGIASVAFAVIESYRVGLKWPWIWIPLAVPLPGAFLIPLFFLLRERALLRRAAGGERT